MKIPGQIRLSSCVLVDLYNQKLCLHIQKEDLHVELVTQIDYPYGRNYLMRFFELSFMKGQQIKLEMDEPTHIFGGNRVSCKIRIVDPDVCSIDLIRTGMISLDVDIRVLEISDLDIETHIHLY